MPHRSRDAAFAALVTEQRGLLAGTALLMFAIPDRAGNVVQSALAQLYQMWPEVVDPRRVALEQILTAQPGDLVLPWQHGEHFQLIDTSASPPVSLPAIVADLAELSPDHRRVIILERFVQLPTAEIAALTKTDAARVVLLGREALTFLKSRDPTRHHDQQLRQQMVDAAANEMQAVAHQVMSSDLAHGRLLLRRRRLRSGLLAVALLVAVMFGVSQIFPAARPEQSRAVDPITTPLRPRPTCDTTQSLCRAGMARDWRTQISQLSIPYVDPERRYFSGYTYSYNNLYDSTAVWTGKGGVLGLDLFKLSDGATEVYIQIATSRRFALRCGEKTGHPCVSTRFMDGNRYILTETTEVSEGLEVQYSPDGDQVITVVARNTSGGKKLDITRGDLITLVQDPRLRLPPL